MALTESRCSTSVTGDPRLKAIMVITQTNKCQGLGYGKHRKITGNLNSRSLELSLCDTCWSLLKAGDHLLLSWLRDFAGR